MLNVLQKKRYVSVGEKKIRARLASQKKNSCRQVGRKKKFLHRKFFTPIRLYLMVRPLRDDTEKNRLRPKMLKFCFHYVLIEWSKLCSRTRLLCQKMLPNQSMSPGRDL